MIRKSDIDTASVVRRGGRRSTARAVLFLAALVGAAVIGFLAEATPASALAPAWKVTVTPNADYFISGAASKPGFYKVEAENVGTRATAGELVLRDTLPAGVTPEAVHFFYSGLDSDHEDLAEALCPTMVECKFPGILENAPFKIHGIKVGEKVVMLVAVAVPADVEGPLHDEAEVNGGGAPAVSAGATNAASANPPFGLLHFDARIGDSAENLYTQAGGHPYQFSTELNFETYSFPEKPNTYAYTTWPLRDPKAITSDLPPGLLANPQGVPHCSLADWFAQECDRRQDSVGVACVREFARTMPLCHTVSPVINLQPQGAFPGELGIPVANTPFALVTAGLRTGSDYGVRATSMVPQTALSRVRLTLWGVPAAEGHDEMRGKECFGGHGDLFASIEAEEEECAGEVQAGRGGSAGVPETPFLIMPTQCSGVPLTIAGRYDTWQAPDEYAEASAQSPAVDGCNALKFEPSIEARPTTNLPDAPSGLQFDLHVPQNVDPEGVATPSLSEAVVKLPQGFTVNPSSGNGLTGCSPEQIGLTTGVGQTPAHFSEEPAHCPGASTIGTAKVETPLLHSPLEGAVYLATPRQNPFESLLAAYVELEGEGLIIKLPGKIEADPATGQITGKFLENPQTPFEDFHLEFFGGARGDLRTPATCGRYETTTTLTPYSAPESGPPAEPTSTFQLDGGGAPCPHQASELPNAPVFRAGTESPVAGAFTPFTLKLAREDGSQEIEKIETTLPPGLTAKLAGVGECSDAQLAQAQSREHEGGGKEEQESPSCPASSEVGEVQVASGAGPTPLYVSGKAYLAGPYKGAPLSLAIITPAVAGPFDLGDVVVRTALYTDPYTAQIKAVSDPIPHILQGIPLDVRSITLKMARPNFTLNPTDCEEMGFSGSATSLLGNVAPLAQRFQVGGCQALPFKPKLAISLKGGVKRHTFPALTATVTMPPGQANIGKAQVTLPHNEQLEQAHITSQVCLQAQLATRTCPPASVYGYAKAETPLLDHPLEGPVYLGVGFGHKLPDLVAELNGQIRVLLHGKVDTGREDGLRNTFEVVPDAPVSKFTLHMFGGKKGLIVNSENLCSKHARLKDKVLARFTAQSAKTVELEPTVKNSCKGKGGKHKKGNGHKK